MRRRIGGIVICSGRVAIKEIHQHVICMRDSKEAKGREESFEFLYINSENVIVTKEM